MSRTLFWAGGLLFLAFAATMGLAAGAVRIAPADVIALLKDPQHDPVLGTILWEIRVPRVARAVLVGGMLSVAGAVFQVLLRNPLADPYVLGVSGGAAVGGIAILLLGAGSALTLAGGALVGALLTVAIVFVLAGGWRGLGGNRLLLTGVVLASFWGALVTLFLSLSQDDRLRSVLFWLMGDLGQTAPLGILAGAAVTGFLLAAFLARPMDALGFGDHHAFGMGVDVRPVRIALYFLGSLLTAAAVSAAGMIGFVGLIVPHAVRLLGVTRHRELVPASALLGGTLVLLADTAARSVAAPVELPVGVVTAFVGAPFFLWLLRREAVR